MTAGFIDTHAHLDFDQFAGEEDVVLKRAAQAGITRLINVGTTLERSRRSVELAQQYTTVWAAVGIHPHDAGDIDEVACKELAKMSVNPKVVAIGEIGLDFHYQDGPGQTVQLKAFARQAAVAAAAKLPIIVHSRDAEEATVAALQEVVQVLPDNRPGVVHCFTGSAEFARKVLDLGFFISFTAPITYPKNEALREVVKSVPLDRMMLETDCPFLPPPDKRGQRNEPAFLIGTARQVAELHGVSLEEVAEQTTANAERLFGASLVTQA